MVSGKAGRFEFRSAVGGTQQFLIPNSSFLIDTLLSRTKRPPFGRPFCACISCDYLYISGFSMVSTFRN